MYPQMKNPSAVPITPQIVAGSPCIARAKGASARTAPRSARAPRKDTNEKTPKPRSAHDPRLIGESGMKAKPPPGLASTSMCQNRSG